MNNQLHEGYYITSCGKVWSFKSNKFLKLNPDRNGYLRVYLFKEGTLKTFFVHRLVAEAYISNPDNLDTVDHKDKVKTHNYISNLQWMTREDNTKKGVSKKVMCIETGEIFDSVTDAANSVDRATATLSNCLHERTSTCAGLHWEFV